MKDEKTATAKVGGITQNIDLGYACFQEKCNRVCIARAVINESVCEDSHAEQVQFATAAVFNPILAGQSVNIVSC